MPGTSAVARIVSSHVRWRNELDMPMPILSDKLCRAQAKRDEDLVEVAPLRDQTLAMHETSVTYRKRRGKNLTDGEKMGMNVEVFIEVVGAAKDEVPAKIDVILEAAGVAKNYVNRQPEFGQTGQRQVAHKETRLSGRQAEAAHLHRGSRRVHVQDVPGVGGQVQMG